MKNEKGVISLFVLFAMLFLLILCLSAYIGIRSKLQIQEYKNLEIRELYSKDIDVVESTEFATTDELIPIYNINQLSVAGTGSYLKVNNKIYQCGIGMSYTLKNNIIVDIDEDLKHKKTDFNDYKLYASTYYINKLSYDIYYYKDGYYWKCIAYQKFNDGDELVKNKTYIQNQFSIISEYEFKNENQFMIIWNDEEGNLSNIETDIQSITNKLTNLNQVEILKKNYKEINKKYGEFYLFVNVGNSI